MPEKAHNDQNNNKGVMCVAQYSLLDIITSAHSIVSVQTFLFENIGAKIM